jgi:cell division septum initiation protein DivIVA
MDAVQKIKELQHRSEELEQQLKQKGISEAKRIAIRQQITAIDNQITQVWGPMLPQGDTHWATHWCASSDGLVL